MEYSTENTIKHIHHSFNSIIEDKREIANTSIFVYIGPDRAAVYQTKWLPVAIQCNPLF